MSQMGQSRRFGHVRTWSALRRFADVPFFAFAHGENFSPRTGESIDSLLNYCNTGQNILPNLSLRSPTHLYSSHSVRPELACLRVRFIEVAEVGYIRLRRGTFS